MIRDATIVFDLDGTLVDTAPDLCDATNHALNALSLAPRPEAELRPWISFGARRMLTEALASHGKQPPEAEVDALLAAFIAYYEANIARRSRPFPHVLDAMQRLADDGARLAVCTNKRQSLSELLLKHLKLDDRFAAIAGRDRFPVYKPHPDHLTGAIALAGGDAGRAVMVGDSATDVATARAAGIPVVAVTFGYTDIPAHDLGADRTIECHSDLYPAIADLLVLRH